MLRVLSLIAMICVAAFALMAPLMLLAVASLVVPLLAAPWLSFEDGGPFVSYLKGIAISFIVLLTLRMTVVCPAAYRIGYAKGVAAVEAQIDQGTVHQFAQRRPMWCLIWDVTLPTYRHFCGFESGVRESLPPHSGDEQFAREALEQLGAVCTEDDSGSVVAIAAKDSSITDADVHWLGALWFLDEIKLESAPITDEVVKYLIQLRRLSKITIVDGRLTESGAQELRERLPFAEIRID